MLSTIIFSFIAVSLLGAFFGIGLAIAAKYLHVAKDEKLINLEISLPGYNCGACGKAGCSAYAEALFTGEVTDPTLCAPGSTETAKKLADILGITMDLTCEKSTAMVHCAGGKEKAVHLFEYKGISDCNAAYSMFQGNKACKYGCLGLGSCVFVCPTDAIRYTKDGLVKVNSEKCIACKKCTIVCPTGVMKMIPCSTDYIVACNSKDKGGITKKACTVGCIGCKICEKKSPEGGYRVENFLASVNYSVKGDRKEAALACPSKCILEIK